MSRTLEKNENYSASSKREKLDYSYLYCLLSCLIYLSLYLICKCKSERCFHVYYWKWEHHFFIHSSHAEF